MDKIIALIAEQISPWLLVPLFALGWILQATGIVGHLLSGRQRRDEQETKERIADEDRADAEAARLVTDRAEFTSSLQQELASVRQRYALDIADYERLLHASRADTLDARKDARKWRHLSGAFGTAAVHRGRLLDALGKHDYKRIDYTQFIAEGGDLSEFEGIE